MNTHHDPDNGLLTISLQCDLTSTTSNQLRPELNTVLGAPTASGPAWKTCRLELLETRMVDSVGLNLIISVLKSVQNRGAKMQVVCANPNVYRTFQFTRLDKHLELIKI